MGDFLLNRYLNNGGKETINNSLPFNGSLSYDKVSVHPFRDFPNISLKLHGLQLADSLATQHEKTPVELEDFYLNASLTSLRGKELNIESIELVGLTLKFFDRLDGYSNLKSLIKKKSEEKHKEKNKDGWTIVYDHTDLMIKDLQLHKINEAIKQHAHLFIDEIKIKNKEVDSEYQLAIDIENIIASHFPDKSKKHIPAQLNQVTAELHLDKTFASAQLTEVQLKEGTIDLLTDSTGVSNYSGLLGVKKSTSSPDVKKDNGITFEIEGARLSVSDVDFTLIDHPGNRHLAAAIKKISTEIEVNPDTSAVIDLHLDVNQLAFNTSQGALLSNSIVKGQLKTNYNHQEIQISCSDLSINDDLFNVKTKLPLDGKTATTLTIEKPDADAQKIRPLLTEKIQKSILPYDVKGPMYAKAHLVFTKGVKKPRVNLDLNVQNKTVVVKGQVVKNADVSATFVNGFFDDARQHTEHKKNMRLFLHKVVGTFNDFKVDTKDALITSSAKEGARLIAKADITGKAASASHFLNHDKFSFQEGAFTLTTDINGSLRNLDDLVAGTDLNLAMKDMQVFYPAGNTSIPLRVLEMKKVGEKTIFEIEGLGIDDGSPIRIQGEIDHLASVLFPGQAEQLQTKANIRASSISWESLIALFGQDGIISAAKRDSSIQAKRSMKQTISGIQQSFHPAVKVTIDTVHYGNDVELLDFHTGLKFQDDKTLVLEETNFKIDKSNVTLDGEVVINQLDFTKFDFDIDLQNLDFDVLMPKFDYFGVHLIKQIHDQPDNLSMHVELSGELDDNAGLKPESLDAYITYESFAEDKFSGSVTLKANPEAEVYITELGITVPLSRIEAASIDNKAYYHLLLKSDTLQQELALDGVVDNIRHFAFKDTEESFEVELMISSPRIVWDDLKQVMAYGNNSESRQSGKIIKESLTKILQDFNPNVKLKVDVLEYSDQLSFNDIFAHAYMDDHLLKIDSANVAYGLDISHEQELPFDLKLALSNIDVAQTLEHFDYFGVEELYNAQQIEGIVWFDLDMSSVINLENNEFETPRTEADIKFALQDVIIEDLETINTIAEKIKRVDRFNVLKFAPIESEIKVVGTRITIKETEIQSNALQAFIEGTIDKSSPENLWISVPAKNVKRPDLETIPEKTGYAGTGRKIFFKWVSSQSDEDGKMKIRLRKKQFYKERSEGIKFKDFKKEVRAERKRIKKGL